MHDVISRGGGGAEALMSGALKQALWSEAGLVELVPIGVYVCDADGVIVQYNKKAAEMWGRSPALGDTEARFCGAFRLYRPDGSLLAHANTPVADALRSGKPQRNKEVWIERPDGTRIAALVNIELLYDDDGAVVGMVNCFQEITERKWAEQLVQASERRLRDLLEAVPGAIYTTDADGRITFFNQAAADLWGHSPELGESEWCGSWRLYERDGTPMPHDQCPMAVALREGRPIRGEEAIAERPNGERVPFLAFPTPFTDETGRTTGAINMLVDVSELWGARRKLRSSEELNRKILESSRDCIKVLDLDARLQGINACGLGYLGVDNASAIVGMDYLQLWDGQDRAAAERAVRRARDGKVGRFTARYRTSAGAETWWDEVISPIVDADGQSERLLVVSRDVTEARQAEEQRKLLLDELNHRVKNMLATVQSIAGQTFRNAPGGGELVRTFEARLLALSRAHEHLSSAGWKSADFGSVLRDILGPYNENGSQRIQLRGAAVRLPPKATVTLAMVLHELATNAAKYGCLSSDGGRLTVAWHVRGNGTGPMLRLTWHEISGPEVQPPERVGFGSRLIQRGVAHELNGSAELDYARSGLRCRIEVPLPADLR